MQDECLSFFFFLSLPDVLGNDVYDVRTEMCECWKWRFLTEYLEILHAGWICVGKHPPLLFLHSLHSDNVGNDKHFPPTGSPVPGHLQGVTAMQAEGFYWHQESFREAIQLHWPEESFPCAPAVSWLGGHFLCSCWCREPPEVIKDTLMCAFGDSAVGHESGLIIVSVWNNILKSRINFLLIDFWGLPQSE